VDPNDELGYFHAHKQIQMAKVILTGLQMYVMTMGQEDSTAQLNLYQQDFSCHYCIGKRKQ
jgi:hypothetical protein